MTTTGINSRGIRIIPVLIDGARIPPPANCRRACEDWPGIRSGDGRATASSGLDGMNKVQVLANVIRSAALTVPERAGWLADDAEVAARSIEHPAARAGALANLARRATRRA